MSLPVYVGALSCRQNSLISLEVCYVESEFETRVDWIRDAGHHSQFAF